MRKTLPLVCLTAILLILISSVNSQSIAIGVSPSILDLGDLEPGSKELANFHIISPSDSTILVYLDTLKGTFNFFNKDDYRGFVYNYSEENVIPWLEILSNPVELRRAQEAELVEGNIRSYRGIDLILNIPEDTEPGYHLVSVLPSPRIRDEGTGQIGTQVVAVSPVRILFKIPGEAIRKGRILDIQTGNIVGNRLEINIHFLNTGTVTISTRSNKILVKDEQGNLIRELSSNIEYVKPGEIKVLKTYLPLENIEDGTYSVYANVDYNTGSEELTSIISLESEKIEKISGKAEKVESKFNWWLLVIFLVIIVVLIIIYRSVKDEN